jgi:hypothetical protein
LTFKSVLELLTFAKGLIDKIHRKDQLLKDYEVDLAKLRQTEFLLQKKSELLDESQVFFF